MISEFSPFYLNNYYPTISHLTFRTTFLPLTKEEQSVLLSFQLFRYRKKHTLTQNDKKLLQDLEKTIDEKLKEFDSANGVFVKLNFRSGKDGFPLRNDLIPKFFEEELKILGEKWDRKMWKLPIDDGDLQGNFNWIALYRALERLQCCRSGKEILNLLLSSSRIEEDLEYFSKKNDPIHIVIREFNPEINGLNEFRCFVKNNEFKSISQYNHPWLIQELQNDEFCEELKLKIFKYWDVNLKKTLENMENYVFDLAIVGKGEIVLIELNPLNVAGKAMFKGEEATSTKELIIKVRRDLEIPYKDHWDGYLKYMMVDLVDHKPYTDFLQD